MEHTAINRKFQDPGHRGRRGHRVRMIHDLRRTFCTELARHDVNQKVEKELSRHKTMVTLEQYYQNVDMDAERAALRKVRKQRA